MKQVKRQFGQWSRVLAMLCCLLPKMAQSDEGMPKQLDGDSAQIILGLCQNSSGKVLSVGRAHWASNTPKYYPGSVQQFTSNSITGVKGDPTFQAAGASNSNLNVTLKAVENGAAYYDADDTQVENLIVSCAYDSGRSAWWAAGRGMKGTAPNNRYVIYLYYIPITGGIPKAYDTGIGGDGNNNANNKHGLLGGPKSLVFDSDNDMLYVTGYQGTTNAYRPVIGQFTITGTEPDFPNHPTLSAGSILALTGINGNNATGWRGVGITQITAGGDVYGIASPISSSSSGFEVFDYTPATWDGSAWSAAGSATRAAVSLSGYTTYVKPTSIASEGVTNKLYVVGAAKNASNAQFGFIASLTTGLALDTTNFNASSGFRATQINANTTAYNDLVYVYAGNCEWWTPAIYVAGYSFNGTNNKTLIGKFTTAGALASWGTNGFIQPIEFDHDEIATAITYDAANGTVVYGGRVMTKNLLWVYKSSGWVRSILSCSSSSLSPYVTGCSGTLHSTNTPTPGAFSIKKGETFTGDFTFTDNNSDDYIGQNPSQAACWSSNTVYVSNPDAANAGELTALEMTNGLPGNKVTVTCGLGSETNTKVVCGSWDVTVLSSVYGPGGNTTQMFAMLP